MIRRPVTAADCHPRWALISQVEHARVAGELAEHWGAPPFEPLVPRDELVATIFHHDDGWAEWERTPGVDPKHGRPLQFTEMPVTESLVIWQRSIDAVRPLGDLAPWLVSGHFSALLRRSNAWQPTRPPESPAAQAFLQRQDHDREVWLAAWQHRDPPHNTNAVAERGLEWLQFFDALSLWLCCSERHEPQSFRVPSGSTLTFTPSSSIKIRVDPWPWTGRELHVQTPARAIPVASYSAEQLRSAVSNEPIIVDWRLTKGT